MKAPATFAKKTLLGLLTLSFTISLTLTATAQVPLRQLSVDTFTNTSSQHATEVEPDTFAYGSTIVTTFQVGRIFGGGASDIGFATSTNGGASWVRGYLPGVTTFYKGGIYSAASDASVAYDAAHGLWMITSLGLANQNAILVSTSPDGIHWNNPITANKTAGFADKEWIVCDNSAASPFFGHCYIEFDDADLGDQEEMLSSTDGGQTWSKATQIRNAFGLGGQPVVQPTGTVIVPFEGNGIQAFSSTDGGVTWGNLKTVSSISDHGVGGSMRTSPLPSAEIDANGTVYVAWQDCRFRTGCSSNDIVFSTSTDGKTWTAVSRIPIDPTTSTVDHFIPGLAVDPTTSGNTAHLGLTYFFFPVSKCGSTCKLGVGFVSSENGGTTWSRPTQLLLGMDTTWTANTSQGRMVGDYISTSFVNSQAFGAFARALTKNGSTFNESMYTTVSGLESLDNGPMLSSAGDKPVPNAHSDHGPREYYDLDGRVPIPPNKRK